mmetsp:Transcript_28198/g.68585  ORF Transcript_28198/g.68585 Transcript_28198/m.68585 type:complete len:468 (-) Transcript_28198:355-1758(-)
MVLLHPIIQPTPKSLGERHHKVPEVLQGAVVTNMVAVMKSLRSMSTSATEIFNGLVVESNKVAQRVMSASERTTKLCATMEKIQYQLETTQKAAQIVNVREIKQWDLPLKFNTNIFAPSTRPPSLQARYESAREAPKVEIMDEYSFHTAIVDGKKVQEQTHCRDYYSNPKFFEQWWIRAQEEALAEKVLARKKNTRNRNKFGSIAHKAQTSLDTSTGHASGLQAIKITKGSGVHNATPQLKVANFPSQRPVQQHQNPPPQPQPPRRGYNDMHPQRSHQHAPPPAPGGYPGHAPPPPEQLYGHTSPPPGQLYGHTPPPPGVAPPPKFTPPPPAPAPAPPPPVPVVPPLPDIPPPDVGLLPPPPDFKKEGSVQVKGGGLLGGLKNARSGLKKAAVQEKKKTGRDAFLEQIRKNQKNRLKKVATASASQRPEPAQETGGGMSAVMKILQMRDDIGGDSDFEEDDDDFFDD